MYDDLVKEATVKKEDSAEDIVKRLIKNNYHFCLTGMGFVDDEDENVSCLVDKEDGAWTMGHGKTLLEALKNAISKVKWIKI